MTEPAHETTERTPKTERRADAAQLGVAEAPIGLLEPTPDRAGGANEPAVRHAALLGNPRLLQRMGVNHRARVVRQMQRAQGNGYVARMIAQGSNDSHQVASIIASSSKGTIARKTCTCGGSIQGEEECAECKAKRLALQRAPAHHNVEPAKLAPAAQNSKLPSPQWVQVVSQQRQVVNTHYALKSMPLVLVQRKPAASPQFEAGAVGSVQYCVDISSGDWRVSGWIWIGIGRRFGRTFIGPSRMYEGTLAQGNEPSLRIAPRGECAGCDEREESGWSSGTAVFPQIFGPNSERNVLKKAGLECGVLFPATHGCQQTVEGICFLDVIQYLGPIGRSIRTIADRIGWEAKAGIDGGFTVTFCKGASGDIVVPRSELCLGGFIEIGHDLSRNKQDHM